MAQSSAAPTAKPTVDWPIADEEFPSHWLLRLVYYARLAPSTHNSQPWKFVIGRRTIDVVADEARWLRVADPFRRELYVSLGCAIESLRIAADFAGCATDVGYFPIPQDATLVARVEVDGSGSKRDGALPHLLPSAVTRRTSHRKFDPAQAVTDEDRRALYTCFNSPDLALHFITERSSLDRLADLELLADRDLFADGAYRSELAIAVGEGFLGTSWLVSKLGQLAISMLPVGRQVAQSDAQRVASSPLAALLSSRHDRPLDQVHVGEAYMRIALTAESRGLRVQPFGQVLEVSEIRVEAAAVAGLDDRYAQHLFRLGHAQAESDVRRRRPLKDMVLRADL